jgi:hypothetical protein
MIFVCRPRAPCADASAKPRVRLVEIWRASRMRVIGGQLSPRAFIGQDIFGNLMKEHCAISVGAGAGAVKIRFRGRR